jgi:diguanylate cyclase
MSLVRDVHQNATKQKIIGAMVRLCHDMGKQIIAEGVESREERDSLVELSCDLLQGYFFAKPGKPFPSPPGELGGTHPRPDNGPSP